MRHNAQDAVIVVLAGFQFILVAPVREQYAVHIGRCLTQQHIIGLGDMQHQVMVLDGPRHHLGLGYGVAQQSYEPVYCRKGQYAH